MSEVTAEAASEQMLSLSLEQQQALKSEFERIALPEHSFLYSVASNLTKKKARAEDLVQETYLRAFRFFHKFQPGSNCKAWLLCILKNLFINGYWTKKKQPERIDWEHIDRFYDFLVEQGRISETDNPEELFISRLMDDEVAKALDQLPVEFRKAIVLVDINEQSYEEAAVQMRCPIGTVRSRVARGRRLLQESLKGYTGKRGFLSASEAA